MRTPDDDTAQLRKQRHLLHEIEQGIRTANREIIHAQIPELDRDRFLHFARFVASLRADYLQAALRFSRSAGHPEQSADLLGSLRQHREAFEEAREAFTALERAIECGYVDISA